MLFLYQIGDLPVYDNLRGGDRRGLSLELTSDWRNPTQEFAGVSGQHSFAPTTRGILDKNEFRVRANVYPSPYLDSDEVQTMLASMGGRRNTPVIAFRYVEDYTKGAQYIDWLVSYGIVTSVPRKSEYFSPDSMLSVVTHEIEVKMELGTRWRRLSPWLWEYRNWVNRVIDPNSPLLIADAPTNKFVHPERFRHIKPNHYFFLYESSLTDFAPEFWGVKYEEEPNDGGYGSDWTTLGDFEFFSDPLRWSAPPSSIYAFTDLATSGTLSISVQRSTGFFAGQAVEEVSELDLAVVDADLAAAGYTGLFADDIIITGLTAPQPGFVYRDGAKIEAARPKWSYPGIYPGECGRGYNVVTIQADGLNPRVAFLHEFGVVS